MRRLCYRFHTGGEPVKEFGELDRFRKEKPRIKDYSKIGRPREIEVSPLVLE
jgi:hypothetical protein